MKPNEMKPRQRAIYIFTRFMQMDLPTTAERAKLCALIVVDEILEGSRLFYTEDYDYWKKVKQELETI